MGLDTEDLEQFKPESVEELETLTPSEENSDEFLEENPGFLEDENVEKMMVVSMYISTKMYDDDTPELEERYEELMNEEGYNPDEVEDALDYLGELRDEVFAEYDL